MSGLIYPPPASTQASQQTQIAVAQNGTAIATVVMNDMGTLATAANQAVNTSVLSGILNNQGTISKTALWGTGSYHGSPALQQVGVDDGRMSVNVILEDSPNLDAFSRLRVSSPGWRFDGQFPYQYNTDVWDGASSSGSLVYNNVNRLVTLVNDAGTNVTGLQSHYYAPYTPGRGQLSFMTFNMKTAPTSQVTKRVGYFDGNNGVFLEWDATTGISVNIASNTTNGSQKVLQANWNIDPLLGTGPSGFTLDLTKVQIFFVSLQALYVGRVIVGFDIDGKLVPVHAFTHANKITAPYIQQASQPVRFEVRGTNAAASQMDAICATVISEGGEELMDIFGRPFAVNTGVVSTPVTVRRPILTIRPKAAFNSQRNHALMIPTGAAAYVGIAFGVVELVRNGTITGPANTPYTDVDTINSTVEYNTNGTSITGGQAIYADYATPNTIEHIDQGDLAPGRLIFNYSYTLPNNNADSLSLVVTSSGSSTCTGSMNWKEIR